MSASPASPGNSLASLIDRRVARHATRTYDWDALKFQADFDPKYRRAQLRYVGTGGTGVAADDNAVAAEHFTFSTMLLPAGCEGPLHIHTDVEEVFFMIRGRIRLFFERDGETYETELGDRDLCSVPAGVYRGLRNDTDEDALMCVMLGAAKPVTAHLSPRPPPRQGQAHVRPPIPTFPHKGGRSRIAAASQPLPLPPCGGGRGGG